MDDFDDVPVCPQCGVELEGDELAAGICEGCTKAQDDFENRTDFS